jgi:nucleoside-diphosphate-sugar epimerase
MIGMSASYSTLIAVFKEERSHEQPLNMYAFSKFQFDKYVCRSRSSLTSQVVGLRYFNVYGPREHLKGRYQSYTQARYDRPSPAGYHTDFMPVEAGVSRYLSWLAKHLDYDHAQIKT